MGGPFLYLADSLKLDIGINAAAFIPVSNP